MASVDTGKNIFECTWCEKSFTSEKDLKIHISLSKNGHPKNSAHEENKPFKCRRCDKGYMKKDSLKNHVARVHNSANLPIKCTICSLRFADKGYLKIHMDEAHTKRPAYKKTPSQRELVAERKRKKEK